MVVEIEVEVEPGLRSFQIIGLPDEAVREAANRVSSALKRAGFEGPDQMNKKVTVNLAPADVKKQGSFFDLAIAVGFLFASSQLRNNAGDVLFVGELSLDGRVRAVPGALGIAQAAKRKRFSRIVIPCQNLPEAGLVKGIEAIAVTTLSELALYIKGEISLPLRSGTAPSITFGQAESEYDFADISGQDVAKRALEVAAAGGHHVLMIGPPGAGKSILAKAFPSLLPPLDPEEGLEVASVLSSQEPLGDHDLTSSFTIRRPFRCPHHTASAQAILGGGFPIKPGEITLAHRGVLFLDELPEFHRDVLEALRQPLEDKVVRIARSRQRFTFPAQFQLIGAANPCPCGFNNDPVQPCICTPGALSRYERKLSGPLIDRIDIFLTIPRLSKEEILQGGAGKENSETVRLRVVKARSLQRARFGGGATNAQMSVAQVKKLDPLDREILSFLGAAIDRLNLSMRGYHKVLKVSRTIADLAGSRAIALNHIAEALQYRKLA